MYELIILSLLMRASMHGYLVARIINDMIGPYARLSNGRLYPLLTRLGESGLIEIDEEAGRERHGERTLRSYRITEAGRKRFHTLMMDTTSNPGEYQRLFLQKVTMFFFLQPSERLHLIDHYLNYCQTHVLHLIAEGNDLAEGNYHHYEGGEDVLPATLDVMRHMADQWRLEVSWAMRLRKQEVQRQEDQEDQDRLSEPSSASELSDYADQKGREDSRS
ncbi:MAG TPA: PadR family transcriptional regulator [Ktedonobacteraceae bacterium]